MDMRFGTWNVRSLYRAGSIMTVYWWESQREKPRRRWVDNIRMDLGKVGMG
jgi:hypothetical protein